MISPETLRTIPYAAYNGRQMMVAYASAEMKLDDKLMVMRGNNRHFTRLVIPHELIPGHHLQIYYQARSPERPFTTPFYVEGWALYWEMRLWDLGWARTPSDRIGMLFWRMTRAARVILTLKYHLGRMTPDEMVAFLMDRVGHEKLGARGEVRRFIQAEPLYQVGYLIGGPADSRPARRDDGFRQAQRAGVPRGRAEARPDAHRVAAGRLDRHSAAERRQARVAVREAVGWRGIWGTRLRVAGRRVCERRPTVDRTDSWSVSVGSVGSLWVGICWSHPENRTRSFRRIPPPRCLFAVQPQGEALGRSARFGELAQGSGDGRVTADCNSRCNSGQPTLVTTVRPTTTALQAKFHASVSATGINSSTTSRRARWP